MSLPTEYPAFYNVGVRELGLVKPAISYRTHFRQSGCCLDYQPPLSLSFRWNHGELSYTQGATTQAIFFFFCSINRAGNRLNLYGVVDTSSQRC